MRDVSRFCGWILIAAIGLLISSRAGWAELPPSAYAGMQDAASEVLQIEVVKVDGRIQRRADEKSHLTVTAKVVCAIRSASGLIPGATITIGYSTVLKRSWGWAGPAPIGILELKVYTAYLNKGDPIYTPAARDQSFIASRSGAEPLRGAKHC